MAQTKEGAKKQAQTIKKIYGSNFWSKIGKEGGSVSGIKKGTATFSREKLQAMSAKGCRISKRTKKS